MTRPTKTATSKTKEKMRDWQELTDKQKVSIHDFVVSKYGFYGIERYKYEFLETGREGSWEYRFEVPKKGLGIFAHSLEKCELIVRVYSITKEEDELGHRHQLSFRLAYSHNNGGTNGCDLKCSAMVREDGRLIEMY